MKTVFVSSTFKDMQFERDAIRDITAPLLNAEARKYHDEIDFCDLRWGIDTGYLDSEEGSKKVLEVCLDEIDRCKPPMVVILGYRYGWIPDSSLIKSEAERKHLKLDDLERSVTALEIEYGALRDRQKFDNTLFYFREIEGEAPDDYLSEDEEHERKVTELKKRIKEITGGKIKEYTLRFNGTGFEGVEDFAELLAEDIREMLLPEWKKTKNMTAFERERRNHSLFIHEKNVMFRARQEEAEMLFGKALAQPVTIIKGAVGSGKSTLFSHIAEELEKTEWEVLPFISGLTGETGSGSDIIKNAVYYLEEKLGEEHYIDEKDRQTGNRKVHSTEEWRNRLAEISAEYTAGERKMIIMVDAVDQLTKDEVRDRLYFIPSSAGDKLHFLMTCTEDFNTPGREYYRLRELKDEDKYDVIDGILARNGRELSEKVKQEMTGLKHSDNPLYLSLVVGRLMLMNHEDFEDIRNRGDGMSAIEEHQTALIRNHCPDNLDDMSAALLTETGRRINEKLVTRTAEYLAVSRNGLRRKDLAGLMKEEWSEIDFSHFVSYMNDCFMQRNDGRYDFTHKSIRNGFIKKCAKEDERNREILEYLKALESEDEIRNREIVYHIIKADDKRGFVEYVTDCKYNERKFGTECAARDVYEWCMADGGSFICELLGMAEEYGINEKSRYLCNFMNFDLQHYFIHTQKELETGRSIFEKNVLYAEYILGVAKDERSRHSFLASYVSVGEIYEKLGERENLERALEYYERGKELSEEVEEEYGTTESKSDLFIFCHGVGRIYEKLGGRENLERALEYYERGKELGEEIYEKSRTMESKRGLLVGYDSVGRIYKKLGGRENLERALEYYEKGKELGEELGKKSRTLKSKSDLSIFYSSVGRIYEKLGGERI